jgi:hypothetical protein
VSHDSISNRRALRRASLEVLRAEAAEELRTVIFERLHAGEDPWEFMEQLPSTDEFVVLSLRAELIAADNGRQPTQDVEYRMLRQIALAYPDLTETVWSMIGREAPLRWSA